MDMSTKGLISWFTRNPVAANLVMILIFFSGALSVANISKEMFPRSENRMISIGASYPGAAPVEVEKGVILPMEAALEGLKGIKEINTAADRDYGRLYLSIEPNEDINELMTQVENRIDGIINLPEDLEKPTVQKIDNRMFALGIVVHGNMTQSMKKEMGDQVRDELLALPAVKTVDVWGVGDYEISIEVRQDRLRELNLTLGEVAAAVRASSLDLPAGIIRAEAGNVLVRTEGKAYEGKEFEEIVLRSQSDGTQLLLSDVATVRDGFSDGVSANRFNRKEAVGLGVFSLEDQNLLDISESVNTYVVEKQQTLPDGLEISIFSDTAFFLNGRLTMMAENLMMGGILVAIMLGLFLNLKVAFWVMLGIPVSFAGAFWLMPVGDVTVNVLSLFAFIMVLGIVVDDAIVIGESVFSEVKADYKSKLAAGQIPKSGYVASSETVISGAKRVATPSTIGVLTTMAAFLPLLFIGGSFDGVLRAVGVVVILCLIFSLIESKLILPSHLVGLKFGQEPSGYFSSIGRYQRKISKGLENFVELYYQPWVRRALRKRYVTLSIFLAMLIITLGLLNSGLARYEFFPDIPGDDVRADLIMQDGSSAESMLETVSFVEDAIYAVDERYRKENPSTQGLLQNVNFWVSSDVQASFLLNLTRSEDRSLVANEIIDLLREEIGLLPNVRRLNFLNKGPSGSNISLSLSGSNPDELTIASAELQQYLGQFVGVYDVYNSQGSGSKEVLISPKPYASQIGIRLSDIANQVRQAFYGEEAQRIQRDSDTVKVMVRYPYDERRSISTLENMHIRAPSGEAIAIGDVADVSLGVGIAAIQRLDRQRTVTVTAEIEVDKIQSGDIEADIQKNFVPQLLEKYPSVKFRLSGGSEEKNEYYTKMAIGGVAALFLIYTLLAVPLRSYIQPIVIMSVIPFGFIGAVIGHMIFDVSVNILSVFGIIALSGVVVNDSLILVEFANRERAKGLSFEDAILNAGKKRFRAILLTTLTTFVGLLPLLFETSMQAQFVIPMAISLSFGILFASVITLVLIPCLYLVVETNHQFVSRIFLLLLLIPTSYLLVFLGIFTLFFANIVAGIMVLMGLLISAGRVRTYFTEPEGPV